MRRFVRPTLRFLAKRSGPEGLGNKRAVRRTIGLEMLEPRLLLSADVMPAAADLTITIDTASNAIVVLDNHNGGAELQRSSLTSRIPLVVTGTEGNDTFRIDIDPNLLPKNRIIVSGGLGDDTLVGPKGGSSWQLDKTGKGYLGNIAFGFIEQLEGSGSAQDTLAGPYGGAEWTLDGDGDGRVAGIGFANFDRLKGSDTGDDIFRVAPRGGSTTDQSLNSGFISIDGGLGSDRDRIIVEGNHFLSAHVIRTGSGIGTIEIDGMKIAHTGINNVHLGALDATQDVVQDYTFTAQSQDTITVGDDASDATLVSLTGSQAGDTTTFAKPTNSLTIVAPGEHAAVTLNSLTLPGIDLKVTAGLSRVVIDPTDDYRTTITVSDGSVVDTSSAEGAAGDITLQANTIDIGKNVMIDASGETGGNFTLTADSRRLTTTTVLEETGTFSARDAAISIDTGTTVNANSIDISALAGDETLNEIMGQYADGAPADLLKFLETVVNPSGIPISILVKRSAADIKITGANLNATGDVSIDANAQSIANGTGVFYRAPINIPGGLAFVYVEAEASATVTLDDTTSIRTTGGAISVTTEGTTTADGTARVSQNFARNNTSPTNPQNVQVAAAIGNVNLVSTIDLGAQTTLSAQTGKVTVMAQGNNSNEPGAETESYKDGLGGFTLGLALSNATVQVTALGTIESGSTGAEGFEAIVNPFKAVNAAADTIAVYSTAQYKTGDAVTYDTNSGGAIRGLTDGRIYYVIVADATHLQLAASRADALAGTAIDLGALPALEDAAGRQSGFSQVRESTGQIIFDYNPGFTVGQKVYYDAAAGLNIGGLQNKNTNDASTVYTVAAVTQSPDGYQWLVTLHDASGAPVTLSLDPLLTDINGIDYAFGLDGSALVFKTAQPGFATGLALTYTQALGFDIPTLADGTTYYLIKDPTDTTNTVFRLAASAADAAASDGFSNTVALGDVDTTATSNDEHTLTAINPGGVSITATLSTTEEAGTKSGQGGEPETSDLASKGEMLPMFGTMIKNVGYLATLPADQSGNLVNPMDQKIANNVPKGSNSNSNFGVAATVAFVKSSNDAKVQIGGTVQSKAGITVDASITHTIQTQAEGVKSPTQAGDT
ncbi:MAG: LEPR-XLL domain-containing protein, partial [Burkholderiales bacterium]|nr:LEPR-XLL domain-containing protein [Burkholderiales bacterium]